MTKHLIDPVEITHGSDTDRPWNIALTILISVIVTMIVVQAVRYFVWIV